MREEIENNIKMLLEIAEKLELDVDGNTLLEIAVKLFQDEEIRKSRTSFNAPRTEAKSPQAENKEELATEKQIGFLLKLGYKGKTENLTKREASELIKSLKEGESNY